MLGGAADAAGPNETASNPAQAADSSRAGARFRPEIRLMELQESLETFLEEQTAFLKIRRRMTAKSRVLPRLVLRMTPT
jgi:hypothetical protein